MQGRDLFLKFISLQFLILNKDLIKLTLSLMAPTFANGPNEVLEGSFCLET